MGFLELKNNMTSEQKSAFIIAQTAMMNGEMEMMKAENCQRERNGESLAYSGSEWSLFLLRWDKILGYNAIIDFFKD